MRKGRGRDYPAAPPKVPRLSASAAGPGLNTAFDVLKKLAEKFANLPALGSCRPVKVHNETKKVPKVVNDEAVEVEKQWWRQGPLHRSAPGAPKGVPITHTQFVSAIAGMDSIFGDYRIGGDYVLAYLPLAHIVKLVLEHLPLFAGVTLGYASPRTLAETSVRNCAGDLREFRPPLW